MGHWNGDSNNFNEYYRSKLLFVDENDNAEKRTQYVEIKKVTGNKIIRINEKYKPEYYVPNNINIIIATNDAKPVFLNWKEEPKAENVNNFFIYQCPNVPANSIDSGLEDKLKARIGHYVRTELKIRFAKLSVRGFSNNRYALAAPITEFHRRLLATSVTNVEMEAEELAVHIVGLEYSDKAQDFINSSYFKPSEYGEDKYIQLKDIRRLVKELQLKGSPNNPKTYVSILQEQGVLSSDTKTTNTKYYGYRILRNWDYYTTVSGQIDSDR
jgi:hypothetical protein